MPLTSKGEEIKANMEKEYGKSKGESVFYASANKNTIKGVHNDRRDLMSDAKPQNQSQAAEQARIDKITGSSQRREQERIDRVTGKKSEDQTVPDPATGAMSTKGPSAGSTNNLPDAATPASTLPAKDCGREMSLDAIKDMGKRIGRY